LHSDASHLARVEWSEPANDVVQRVPEDKLHPDADPAVDLICTVHGDHVGMADPGEQSPFFDDRHVGEGRDGSAAREQLDSDFAVAPRVPGAIDRAV
jgi:hypothetical protein